MKRWLDAKKAPGRLGAVMLAMALGAGCKEGSTTEAPSAAASDALGTASDSSHFAELEGLIAGVEGELGRPGHNQQDAFRCDPEPEVTEVQVCGRTIPSRMHFEWSGCDLTAMPQRPPPPPPGAGEWPDGQRPPPPPPGMGPPPGDGHRPPPPPGMEPPLGDGTHARPVSSSGTVELVHDVTVSGTCGSGEESFDSLENATFSITQTLSDGTVRSFQGTTASTGSHSASDSVFTRTGTLDTTREVRDADGQLTRSLHLSGSVSVTFDHSSGEPTRTLNGSFEATYSDSGTSVITVTNLLRPAPFVCRFPISGTVKQVQQDGTEHVLVYGPECGTATLDGAAYTPHAGGPGGHGGPHGGPGGGRGPRPGGPGTGRR